MDTLSDPDAIGVEWEEGPRVRREPLADHAAGLDRAREQRTVLEEQRLIADAQPPEIRPVTRFALFARRAYARGEEILRDPAVPTEANEAVRLRFTPLWRHSVPWRHPGTVAAVFGPTAVARRAERFNAATEPADGMPGDYVRLLAVTSIGAGEEIVLAARGQ